MKYLPSREACKILGLHPNTLRRYANNGTIESYKTESGQRRYNVEAYLGLQQQTSTVCYCRVSSPKQQDDLARQVEFMQSKYPNAKIIKDIGSGLNYKRKGLKSLLERAMGGNKLKIVVVHKDRLARFGFELIEWVIQQNGGEIVVLNQNDFSSKQELINDILSILHLFSGRLHELKNYKKQVRQALSQPKTETDI